jgi:hypothetical protein
MARMDGTIRDCLKRRVRLCLALAVGGWLLIALGGALSKSLPEGFPPAALPLAGFLLLFGALLAMQRVARCPKCRARLGQTIAMPVAFSWGRGPRIGFCPYCGVSLDEHCPRPQAAVPSQDPIK